VSRQVYLKENSASTTCVGSESRDFETACELGPNTSSLQQQALLSQCATLVCPRQAAQSSKQQPGSFPRPLQPHNPTMLIAKRVPVRYLLGLIRWELAATFLLATLVSIGDNYIDKDLPPGVLTYFLSVVSVIIVFRTSQSYSRWWEARGAWGNIVNDMRTLARQVLFFHSPHCAEEILEHYRTRSIERLIAFPYLLAHQLRHQDLQPTREMYLPAEEAQKVVVCDNQAAGVLALQAMATQQAFSERLMTPQQQTQIDDSLTRLTASMGLCERIKNAVFPGIYSQFYYFLLYLFVLLLPLSIFDDLGFVEIPATLAIATFFFLLEKTAASMQNPFENQPTDVEMSRLSKRIEIDLRQMAGEKDVPPISPPEDFYIL